MDLVLASTSPRKIQLLHDAGLEFRTRDHTVDEGSIMAGSADATASARAEAKALAVAAMERDSVVLSADTVVTLEGGILDKAGDADDVRRMLGLLSGKEHTVITAVALCVPPLKDAHVIHDLARVTFKRLADDEIEGYAETGEGVGKAGGYAIQGKGGELVARLEGDQETVIGLPTALVLKMLDFGD